LTDWQRENCFLTEVESKFLLDFRTDMPKTSSDQLDFYLSGPTVRHISICLKRTLILQSGYKTFDKITNLIPHSRFDWFLVLNATFSYIMATSFSGGRSLSTRREPPTMGKQLVNFITCGCESSAPFFVIYKAGHEHSWTNRIDTTLY
jgi:hypothetical protein